jgi:hypothetical protein
MSSFGEYVDGKTIAIVGPAPAPYDQTAEVDAHDLVYRTHFYATVEQMAHPKYPANVLPTGYGRRVDMVYMNAGTTQIAASGDIDHQLPTFDWVVTKNDGLAPSGLTNARTANRPPMKAPGTQNQITGMLWDLTFYHPAKVTVFGANFYAAPLEDWYDPSYINPYDITRPNELLEHTRSIHWHDQADNRRIVQMVRQVGWLAGDDRYLSALDMDFLEYNPLLEAELTRAHQANFP